MTTLTEPVTEVAIAHLIEDLSIYPRHAVDDAHVSALARALRAGATLPPIVVERLADGRPGRIVDGWHRVRATKRVLGPEATISVEMRTYASEADIVFDAVALNARHGRRMDRIDEVRAALLMEERGISVQRIAVALEVPPERVLKLRVRTAEVSEGTPGVVPGTTTITLKRSVGHMAGERLNDAQAKAHMSAPGVSYLLVARQLREGLDTGLVNRDDERLTAELRELLAVLRRWLR